MKKIVWDASTEKVLNKAEERIEQWRSSIPAAAALEAKDVAAAAAASEAKDVAAAAAASELSLLKGLLKDLEEELSRVGMLVQEVVYRIELVEKSRSN